MNLSIFCYWSHPRNHPKKRDARRDKPAEELQILILDCFAEFTLSIAKGLQWRGGCDFNKDNIM